MMEQKERSIGHKLLLVGVPLLALYLFYQFNVVKLFNEGFTGHELMDLDAVKKLFRYHTFGLYVAFEVKHLVGYIMLCGFVLLAASEAFLVGRFCIVLWVFVFLLYGGSRLLRSRFLDSFSFVAILSLLGLCHIA